MILVQGVNRLDYNPLRHPVSSLSIGESGWMQSANFIITGILLLVFTLGLHLAMRPSRAALLGPALIGMVGLGLIGAGLFTADPVNGYPPGTPLVPQLRSLRGGLHDLFGIPVFMGLPLACLVFSRRFAIHGDRGWAIYSLLAGVGMLLTFILAGMGFNQVTGFVTVAGVYQRLSIILGFTWIAMVAGYYLQL
jgi:hypothetical protein